jgi:hypothetical protein
MCIPALASCTMTFLTDLFSEEEIFFSPDNCSKSCFQSQSDSNLPVCILQTYLEGMQIHLPISQAVHKTSWFWSGLFFPPSLSNEGEGIQILQSLPHPWCDLYGPNSAKKASL